MSLVGRVFVIFFAFLAASMAAGMTIAFGLLGTGWPMLHGDPVERGWFWGVAVIGSGSAAVASFLPLLLLIVVAETFRLRSVLLYALAGVGIMLLAYYGSGLGNPYEESIDHAGPLTRNVELVIAAGAVFGLVYWLLAGRKAGAWRDRRRTRENNL
jgi:hypothetical protein